MNPDGTALEVFANTGGRVLGFDFDATGNLVAADAVKGLLSISPDKFLSFANGVALSQDEQTLFVNETGKYRVWKIAVQVTMHEGEPSGWQVRQRTATIDRTAWRVQR